MPKNLIYLAPRGFGGKTEYNVVITRIRGALDKTFSEVSTPLNVWFFVGCSFENSLSKEERFRGGQINILQFKTRNFFSFIFKVVMKVKSLQITPQLVVAGDPKLGFIASYLFGLMCSETKIQTQIHGNPEHFFSGNLIPTRVREAFVKFVIARSSSIRLVSNHQRESFERFIGATLSNVTMTPVPFYVSSNPPICHGKSVAFVGRFHDERGVNRWLEIAAQALKIDPGLEFTIVGDGPKRESFLQSLNSLGINKFVYHGWLGKNELMMRFSTMGLLLSTAETETYGVTLREALCSGLHIVAFENDATIELQSQFPKYIHTSKNDADLAKMVCRYHGKFIPQHELENIRRIFTDVNSESSSCLGESWAKILNGSG